MRGCKNPGRSAESDPLKIMRTSWADHHPCPARNVVFAREWREGSRKKTGALGLRASACRGREYNLSGWLKAAVGIDPFVFSTTSALPRRSTPCLPGTLSLVRG